LAQIESESGFQLNPINILKCEMIFLICGRRTTAGAKFFSYRSNMSRRSGFAGRRRGYFAKAIEGAGIMKKFSYVAAALAAFGIAAPATAADLPAKVPVYAKAPAIAPAFSWERCYVGAHIGYGWGRSFWNDGFGTPTSIASINPSGFIGGGQAGCNWQPSKSFVLGIEGEFWWSGIRGSQAIMPFVSDFTARNRWDADVALRVGVPIDRALIYVKGGAAFGSFSNEAHYVAPLVLNYYGNYDRWGWLIGAGLEYALGNNWSAKIEYNYIDYGTGRVTFIEAIGAAPPTYTFAIRDTKHVLKLGVNYLFGGPVVAKY
jgi:outer membrane immunogenic protein